MKKTHTKTKSNRQRKRASFRIFFQIIYFKNLKEICASFHESQVLRRTYFFVKYFRKLISVI